MFCTYQLGKHLFVYSCVCFFFVRSVEQQLSGYGYVAQGHWLTDSFNSVKHAAQGSVLSDNSSHISHWTRQVWVWGAGSSSKMVKLPSRNLLPHKMGGSLIFVLPSMCGEHWKGQGLSISRHMPKARSPWEHLLLFICTVITLLLLVYVTQTARMMTLSFCTTWCFTKSTHNSWIGDPLWWSWSLLCCIPIVAGSE